MFGLHSTRCSTIMTYPRSRDKSLRRSAIFCADGIRAMPSARALLVASLLTEPPFGCLGPSGNDRYRKRSLRSQNSGGFASRLPNRGGSFAMNRPPADVFGRRYWRIHRMTRIAFCRKSPRVPTVCWLGSWVLGTSDGGRQGKSAAFGSAHVVGGVQVFKGDKNDHAGASSSNRSEINAPRAVGLRKSSVRHHEFAR